MPPLLPNTVNQPIHRVLFQPVPEPELHEVYVFDLEGVRGHRLGRMLEGRAVEGSLAEGSEAFAVGASAVAGARAQRVVFELYFLRHQDGLEVALAGLVVADAVFAFLEAGGLDGPQGRSLRLEHWLLPIGQVVEQTERPQRFLCSAFECLSMLH
jgi:hypothetical protein